MKSLSLIKSLKLKDQWASLLELSNQVNTSVSVLAPVFWLLWILLHNLHALVWAFQTGLVKLRKVADCLRILN